MNRLVPFVLLAFVSVSLANHGPGTSGGGSSTMSGETLQQGKFDLDFRVDYTSFEDVSRAGAERRALKSGEFDALDHSYVTTFSLAYGIFDDLQAAGTIGYYKGAGFVDAESEDGNESESSIANPEGLTDLYLTLKWRVLKGAPGNLALIGGIKIPTGRDDVHLENHESLEPSSQPGTGSIDYQFGIAYSRFLTSHITIDASALYTLRTEHDHFEVGDRFDAGTALAYRITPSIKTFPNISVFGEILYVWLGKDNEAGDLNPNSGGNIIYLSPGARIRFTENISFTVAPAFPILQDLNGDQIEASWKLSTALSISF